ncbi:chaperonin-like RBCX protein 1, chloroplastic [Durio zibethinus]|uniref:Chaperonin-like RBCX protein 1, chloroplastic n=1 Tax=Durio zibethinus TaxID=66656 RepID=A0A6P5WJM6_DURZI|nr:chaperonin-like RBCX protein 1, chloroplastic [Durio zibethinus]
MESLAVVPLTQPSFFPSKPINWNTGFPSWPCKQRSSHATRLNCQKMYVPGFGEASPEAKSSKNLHNFFNYIAVKIVSAQLQSYNPEAYKELMEFLNTHSLNDGDKFCASLMRESSRHKSLALRILEVRAAYCKHDFEWDNLKRLAFKMVEESNTKLMREYVLETSRATEKETGK